MLIAAFDPPPKKQLDITWLSHGFLATYAIYVNYIPATEQQIVLLCYSFLPCSVAM